MMSNEMYLQKSTQNQTGEYVGSDEEGNPSKGIMAFMMVGLKQSVPIVVQAIQEVTYDGQWLYENISANIEKAVFCVNTCFFDIVHLAKNVRNNL